MVDMNLTGLFYENIMQLNKYLYNFSEESIKKELLRLTNQLWKLIPMRENGEDWNKQLNTVVIEIAGLGEIFYSVSQFLQLLSKLEGLQKIETDFDLYRKTVFESINLLQEIKNGIWL